MDGFGRMVTSAAACARAFHDRTHFIGDDRDLLMDAIVPDVKVD
jgi:hypothetical protein